MHVIYKNVLVLQGQGHQATQLGVQFQDALHNSVDVLLVGHGMAHHICIGEIGEDIFHTFLHSLRQEVADLLRPHLGCLNVRCDFS